MNQYKKNVFSQNGEDGIIEYLLSKMPDKDKMCVEFGAWDGMHMSNTFNLVKNFGYEAIYIEGDADKFKDLQKTQEQYPKIYPINKYVGIPIPLETILYYTPCYSFPDFDIMSVDVDGMDYKIWKSLETFEPKIVVIEINSSLEPTHIMTEEELTDELLAERGVNYMTMVELGKKKNYSIITHTGNCIFVHNDYKHLFELPENPMDVFDTQWQNN